MKLFTLWTDLTTGTKRLIIAGIFTVIIVSMITGYFPELVALIRPNASK